jgi:hypothetical protein
MCAVFTMHIYYDIMSMLNVKGDFIYDEQYNEFKYTHGHRA